MGNRLLRSAVLLLAIAGLWVAASPAGASSQEPAASLSTLEQGVLADINTLRKQHGLAPLHLSASLSDAARQHSAEMAARGYFSHDSANGSSFDKRIARYYPMGRNRFWSVGENLLWSSPDVDPSGALQLCGNRREHRQ